MSPISLLNTLPGTFSKTGAGKGVQRIIQLAGYPHTIGIPSLGVIVFYVKKIKRTRQTTSAYFKTCLVCNIVKLIAGINSTHIWLADPEEGRIRKMTKDDFQRVWFDFDESILGKKSAHVRLRCMIIVHP